MVGEIMSDLGDIFILRVEVKELIPIFQSYEENYKNNPYDSFIDVSSKDSFLKNQYIGISGDIEEIESKEDFSYKYMAAFARSSYFYEGERINIVGIVDKIIKEPYKKNENVYRIKVLSETKLKEREYIFIRQDLYNILKKLKERSCG